MGNTYPRVRGGPRWAELPCQAVSAPNRSYQRAEASVTSPPPCERLPLEGPLQRGFWCDMSQAGVWPEAMRCRPPRHDTTAEGRTIPESERCATRRRVRNGRRALALCVMVLAGVAACGDSRDPVSPIVPAQLVALTSTDIVAVAGSVVAPAPMARVLDSRGVPVGNVWDAFELAAGEETVVGRMVTSDGAGVMRAGTWTLGTTVGSSIHRARLSATPSIAVDFMV